MYWKIRDIQNPSGKKIIAAFIDKQEKSTKAKITRTILLLERYGPFLGMPYCRKLEENIWELRIQGKEAIRVFYTLREEEVILLHIFKKKSQKIRSKELELARERLVMIVRN